MGWVRLDDGMHDHPKFVDLDPFVVGVWTLCRTWAARHPCEVGGRKTAGVVTLGVVKRFAGRRAQEVIHALTGGAPHGLWDVVEDGWRFHDADQYEPAAGVTTPEEVSAKRRAAGQRGASTRWQNAGLPSGLLSGKPDGCQSQTDAVSIAPTRPDPTKQASLASARKRATQLPADFIVSDGMRQWAHAESPLIDVDRETAKFRDHAAANGKAFRDWTAAWRTWMRNAQEYAERGNVRPIRPARNVPPDKEWMTR